MAIGCCSINSIFPCKHSWRRIVQHVPKKLQQRLPNKSKTRFIIHGHHDLLLLWYIQLISYSQSHKSQNGLHHRNLNEHPNPHPLLFSPKKYKPLEPALVTRLNWKRCLLLLYYVWNRSGVNICSDIIDGRNNC